MKKWMLVILCMVLSVSPLFCYSISNSFINNPTAINNAAKSVLYIEVFTDNEEEYYTGSGFIAFDSQTLVTNYHVIKDAVQIFVYNESFFDYKIDQILAVDEVNDIAILSIKETSNLLPLKLSVNTSIVRGQSIATIGSPKGRVNSYSDGTISAVYTTEGQSIIQFTAPISPGSSGGALFNEGGEVIGITTASVTDSQNLNLATHVKHVIDLYQRYNPKYMIDSETNIGGLITTNNPKNSFKPTDTIHPNMPSLTPKPISLVAGRLKSIIIAGKLVVATSPDYAPFEFPGPDGTTVGADMKLAHYIANKLGVELVIDEYDFAGVLVAIALGKADLSIAALSPVEERKSTMDFSEPYFGVDNEARSFNKGGISIALPKNEPELLAFVNEAIAEVVDQKLFFDWMAEAVEINNSMIN